jgi:hypothetical protein
MVTAFPLEIGNQLGPVDKLNFDDSTCDATMGYFALQNICSPAY